MTQEVIAVRDISIQIGNQKILKKINCTIGAGEFVGIIGPNGAGKSTLLLGLRGFLPTAGGEIRLLGRSITDLSEKELARQVAYMQQEVNVGFGYTAWEVVLTGRYPYLKWWQHEGDKDREIAQKYMEFTGVDMLAAKTVNSMSGGERQRVLLAKVLTQETPLIFLDEPTASLDLAYQEEIFRYCQLICQQGKTVLLVAHDVKLAAKFCSRLLLVSEGGIIADGSPRSVITRENLYQAYGLHAAVFMNQVTGNLDIHTYASDVYEGKKGISVHLLCGGGAGGRIIRLLYEHGYSLTVGIVQPNDVDAHVAEAFAIPCIVGKPFSLPEERSIAQNHAQAGKADWVVLSNLVYGEQNIANLKAAFAAKKVIVIEDTPIEQRDLVAGEAARLYTELVQLPQTVVMTSEKFFLFVEEQRA